MENLDSIELIWLLKDDKSCLNLQQTARYIGSSIEQLRQVAIKRERNMKAGVNKNMIWKGAKFPMHVAIQNGKIVNRFWKISELNRWMKVRNNHNIGL